MALERRGGQVNRVRLGKAKVMAGLVIVALLSGCASPLPIAEPGLETGASLQANGQPSETNLKPSGTPKASAEPAETAIDTNQLAALLEKINIAAEYQSGYDRDLFEHWIDADSDGCNTRREVLIAESLTQVQVTSGCEIVGGTWLSAYDKIQTIDFSELDIDHLVPLKEAWDSGAYSWDYETRRRFANDLGFEQSLIAVTASSNRSKSDKDPAQWLPSNSGYLCQYTADWLQVKYRWGLSIDSAEALALGSLVTACEDFAVEIPTKATITVAQEPTQDASGNDPKFGSCKEAKANGFGPYVKGIDDEYDWYRDGDKDGTVCE